MQQDLIEDPEAGDVVGGTGGLRKVRFAPPEAGKSGGVRVCYAFYPAHGVVLLVTAYGKNTKANLTPAEKKVISGLLKQFGDSLGEAESDDE